MQAILGVQTRFSFHWAPASPAAWFSQAKKLGYTYLGIADNAALHGLPAIVDSRERRGRPGLPHRLRASRRRRSPGLCSNPGFPPPARRR